MTKQKPSVWATCILLLTAVAGSAQQDTINQLNAAGKKQGYWRKYLDLNRCPADSAKAYFVAYEVYDNGRPVLLYLKDRFIKRHRVAYSAAIPEQGKAELLHGSLTFYDSENRLLLEERYAHGYPVFAKYYTYDKRSGSQILDQYYDFSRRYNNTPGSFYFELRFPSGAKVAYWYRKGEKCWKSYRIND